MSPADEPARMPLDLCFKGSREYVHGTDMYDAIAGFATSKLHGEISALQLGIHRFFSHAPDLVWFGAGQVPERNKSVVANFSMKSGGATHRGWLEDTTRPVACRRPYDEDRIGNMCRFDESRIILEGTSEFRPIETIVAMTKQLHNRLYRGQAGRWIFTKLELRRPLVSADASFPSVSLLENLHNRLTKSEIGTTEGPIGHVYFSLVPP